MPIQAPEQEPQFQEWIPAVGDLTVEVVAPLPLRAEVISVTRLPGDRQLASNGKNDYAPTIPELIRLAELQSLEPPTEPR